MKLKGIVILLLYVFNVSAQQKQLDSLFTANFKKGRFDGSVLITKNNQIIFEKQYGLANRQFNVPIHSQTRFPIASITKLYASVMAFKLKEQGKLDLNSNINTYLPNLLPNSNKKIRVKDLVHHTSGLPNEKIADYMIKLSPKEFISKRIKDTLLFEPGSKYRYNNVNFILLTAILEQVSAKPWASLLDELISQPLGLKNTGIARRDSIISNLAYGYYNYSFGNEKVKDPLQNNYPLYLENYAGAGAMFTTPGELLQFSLALERQQIISKQSLAELYQPEQKIGLVENSTYYVSAGGYIGTESINAKKINIVERNGNIGGFNHTFLQLPDLKYKVIIFCNTDAGNLKKIAKDAIAIITR
ncbi:serine hydrolase domain-containing protein [Pedobacter nanyangensis]|uniref:serine hydrolase domain-containing protein n=1 Tax=Pedobacter nanyangensis TaxID=1562389 RepID=UPI000DE29DEE|nr:serine hydrolase domain-containing protein [Pedobacter nanyangensis]